MKGAEVSMHGMPAGILEEIEAGKKYRFTYIERYNGPSIALTMPVDEKEFIFDRFPPFFDGLLPEGLVLQTIRRFLNNSPVLSFLRLLNFFLPPLFGVYRCLKGLFGFSQAHYLPGV